MSITYIVLYHIERKSCKISKKEKELEEEKPRFILYVIIDWILLTDVGVILAFYLLKWLKSFKH